MNSCYETKCFRIDLDPRWTHKLAETQNRGEKIAPYFLAPGVLRVTEGNHTNDICRFATERGMLSRSSEGAAGVTQSEANSNRFLATHVRLIAAKGFKDSYVEAFKRSQCSCAIS